MRWQWMRHVVRRPGTLTSDRPTASFAPQHLVLRLLLSPESGGGIGKYVFVVEGPDANVFAFICACFGADLIDKFCERDTFKGEFFSELHFLNWLFSFIKKKNALTKGCRSKHCLW